MIDFIMWLSFLQELNHQQKQAVINTEGPILILAGAGSGKTRVLTYKAVFLLLEKKIPPENLLLITFTNKAAQEMKGRIAFLLKKYGFQKKFPFAGTFHSLCARILRENSQEVGFPKNFLIYDEDDQKKILKEILQKNSFPEQSLKPALLLNLISQIKNELITPSQYQKIAYTDFQKKVALIYHLYQKALKKNQALDFDDLLFLTVSLFRKNSQLAQKYQNRIRYLFVDEYQDTNHAQYELTKILTKKWRNISVVGDAAQSIYSFRGADFRNVLNFQKDFPEVKTFYLQENYRSSQNILDAAFSVISRNITHPSFPLKGKKPAGPALTFFQAENEKEEAIFLLRQILKEREKNKRKYSHFAIFYRLNAQSRVIEETLLHFGLPYLLVGGIRFYERREVKDILAYLKLLLNPQESLSLKRIQCLGEKRFQKYLHFQKEFWRKNSSLSTAEIIQEILQVTSYLQKYDPHNPQEAEKIENVKELQSVAKEFPSLEKFLENIALIQHEYLPSNSPQEKVTAKKDAITLMTLHAAKGLEFEIVFITGLEEGLFPHARALFDREQLEEERRLFYVGLTRAKEKLYLTAAKERLFFGLRNRNQVSRFLSEIPSSLIKKTEDYLI